MALGAATYPRRRWPLVASTLTYRFGPQTATQYAEGYHLKNWYWALK